VTPRLVCDLECVESFQVSLKKSRKGEFSAQFSALAGTGKTPSEARWLLEDCGTGREFLLACAREKPET
jgi:hypothetical protein